MILVAPNVCNVSYIDYHQPVVSTMMRTNTKNIESPHHHPTFYTQSMTVSKRNFLSLFLVLLPFMFIARKRGWKTLKSRLKNNQRIMWVEIAKKFNSTLRLCEWGKLFFGLLIIKIHNLSETSFCKNKTGNNPEP